MKYLIQNDEAQSRKVFNELCIIRPEEYLSNIKSFIENYSRDKVNFYRHSRKESDKERELISLECLERITTSMILKQIHHFFSLPNSNSSHGYRVQNGFKNGFIFEPWLYLWIQFLSNISTFINNPDNSDCYIIKADIASFYNKVDHDKLKRILLDSSPLSTVKEKLTLLDSQSLEKYKKLITICLDISKATVTDDKGLPQGPAFARFFAELYLSEIDSKFEELLSNDSILLYQRYVDDIFIVCKSENEAKVTLSLLESELNMLGLEIKHSKTLIKKVADFSPDYDKYRSQSKYSVDRISTNFSTATNEEKSHAINEFISLIQSDTKQDDYSFIFSHLRGVAEVEQLKNDEIDDILASGVGRGSLYRNLFNHVLEEEKNWHYLISAKTYNSLQSEVLTSTIINFIEEGKNSHDKFIDLMNEIYDKLTLTNMVNEHLLQMNLLMGLDVDYKKMSANSIVDVVSAFPLRLNIKTTAPLLEQINTELNSMDDKNKIINVLYALSRTAHIETEELKKISSLFFSYIALNMVNAEFSQKEEFINESLSYTIKYHYLISLFSLSKVNTSRELLISMWKYCACMHNNIKHNINEKIDYGWIHKIASIELDQSKLYVLLSSIVDGEIFRGTTDKRSVFKTYHTLLLIRLSEKISEWKSDDLDALLEKISRTSNFYEWIINRDQTDLLPNSREWFDSNIIYNNTIMLKRDNRVLIRKPYELFYDKTSIGVAEDGYGEIIENYNTNELNTVLGVISNLSFKQFIEFLTNELESKNEYGLPNIFTNTVLVRDKTLKPFTNEIYSPRYFIFEENNELVSIKENSTKVFIELMFKKYAEATNFASIEIHEKYIANIPDEIDLIIFLKHLSRQLKAFSEMDDVSSNILIDLSMASAFYSSISDKNPPLTSFEKFTEFYLPNEEFSHSTYIYSVDDTMSIDDANPKNLTNSILSTITKTKNSAFPFLMLDIENGLIDFQNTIENILSKDEIVFLVSIESFSRCQVKLQPYTKTLELGNNESFDYSHVKYINFTGHCIEEITLSHSFYINKASHIYHSKIGGFIYLIALPPSLSKTYRYIVYLSRTLSSQHPRTFTPYEINKVNISKIERFEHAVHVIRHHKGIQYEVAKDLLIKWLSSFPEKYREIFVLLIASHQYITSNEIGAFCDRILKLIDNNENAMMIKKVEDYNGTIRCFHQNDRLSRKLSSLDPALIDINRSDELSIIVDVIISGTQIYQAMNFYVTGSGNNNCYFDGVDINGIALNTKLAKVSKLKIYCILYTQDAIDKIEESLKKIMPSLKHVEISCGRDIGDSAYFGTTTAIGNLDKEKISKILCDEEECLLIYSYLKHPTLKNKEFRKRYVLTNDKISKTNLVARFQSLPKMCFSFLYLGLKTNNELHPMDRVLETSDLK
nr:RNA-directed DNA polymerase [Pantoea coffeiphila]